MGIPLGYKTLTVSTISTTPYILKFHTKLEISLHSHFAVSPQVHFLCQLWFLLDKTSKDDLLGLLNSNENCVFCPVSWTEPTFFFAEAIYNV